jgi:hypothetical protein
MVTRVLLSPGMEARVDEQPHEHAEPLFARLEDRNEPCAQSWKPM